MSDSLRAKRDASLAAENAIREMLPAMRPKDRMRLAHDILAGIIASGEDTYEHFQSAQAAGRYIRRAVRALEGLN